MWVSRKAHDQLRDDLCAEIKCLRERLNEIDERTKPHEVMAKYYQEFAWIYSDVSKPVVARVSLWDMIHAIRKHLGLEVSEVKAPKEKW